jgi:hypothetical protein
LDKDVKSSYLSFTTPRFGAGALETKLFRIRIDFGLLGRIQVAKNYPQEKKKVLKCI